MSANFTWKSDEITPGLESLKTKTIAALGMYARTKAEVYKGKMKANRPWTDRTGMAKARLDANVTINPREITIVLSHGVDYGVWLELARSKRYAIIAPTINLEAPDYFLGMSNLFNKIKVL